MNEQIRAASIALCDDSTAATKAHSALLDSEPERARPLLARGEALRQEAERRARTGVRVTLNTGDYEQRRADVLAESVAYCAKSQGDYARHASALRALLPRALALMQQMAGELNAPAHAAAVRAEAEAAAAQAAAEAAQREREAPMKYLAKLNADDERLQRTRASAAAAAPAPARPARIEW